MANGFAEDMQKMVKPGKGLKLPKAKVKKASVKKPKSMASFMKQRNKKKGQLY